jgi:hypothetical protein
MLQRSRWNYHTLMAETAVSFGLMKILNPTVMLAFYLSFFTTLPVLFALIPLVLFSGAMFSQLFWAGFVSRLKRRKPIFMLAAVISRLSPLLFLASALVAGRGGTVPVLLFFAGLTVFASTFGLLGVLWTGFVAVTAKEGRGRFLGLAFFLDGAIGIGGALLIKQLLTVADFPANFVLVFTVLSGYGLLAIVPAWLFVEEESVPSEPAPPVLQALGQLPQLFQQHPPFGRYMKSRMLVATSEMSAPFFTAHAIASLGATGVHVGTYATLNVVGGLLANLLLGRIGDRFGFMAVFRLGFAVGLFNLVVVFLATGPAGLYLPMFLMGAYMQCVIIAVTGLTIETSPPGRLPLFQGLGSGLTGPILALMPLVGAGLTGLFGFHTLLVLCMLLYVVNLIYTSRPIPNYEGVVTHAD